MTETEALEALKKWCQGRARIVHYFSTMKVALASDYYWAVVVRLFAARSFRGVYGFHIYPDGEVKCVGRLEGYGGR